MAVLQREDRSTWSDFVPRESWHPARGAVGCGWEQTQGSMHLGGIGERRRGVPCQGTLYSKQ